MTTTNPAPKDNTTFGNFEPKEVLIWLDGPRTFTLLDQDEQLCLAHWLREVGELWQYVVVRVNDNILRELHDGERSLPEALQHPIVYLVDVRPDFTVESAHQTAWENLPQDALPMPGTMIRRELELYFRITSMQNDSPEQLTVREQQILEYLKDGERHSIGEISRIIGRQRQASSVKSELASLQNRGLLTQECQSNGPNIR